MKTVVVIGAGPAGLSAAYELLRNSSRYKVIVLEQEPFVGGLSKTFEFEGGRIDVGGHRFFSKQKEVLDLWGDILPLGEDKMLLRDRSSHILWNGKLIQYPLQMSLDMLLSLSPSRAIGAIVGYLRSQLFPRNVVSLEDFYINRFGLALYRAFFEEYTRKLWGISAGELSADWGVQRVNKISLSSLVKTALNLNAEPQERSLIDSFFYPSHGAGQLWSELAKRVESLGGRIVLDAQVNRVFIKGNCIEGLCYLRDGRQERVNCDFLVSSMPLRDLGRIAYGIPWKIKEVCDGLDYRSMVIVGLDLPKAGQGPLFSRLKNDSWVYLQDVSVAAGRCQILNNWSPSSAFHADHLLLELEYFCDKDDALWNRSDSSIVDLALADLIRCGVCGSEPALASCCVRRIPDAYPVYAGQYYNLAKVRNWADGISNLLCIGRNGQHRYNNMDQSAANGIESARIIMDDMRGKSHVWDQSDNRSYLEAPGSF